MKLTDKACKAAQGKDKPYKLADGGGMFLDVRPNNSKYWRLKYRLHGKEKLLALGVYPDITLLNARKKRDEAKALIREGIDPSLEKRTKKLTNQVKSENSFEAIARDWHDHNKAKWTESYAAEVLNRMEKDVFPSLGVYPITDIVPPLILQTMRKIEARGAHEIARRTLQCTGQVFRYAIGEGKAESDPTRDLVGQLKPFKKSHYAALDIKQLPEFIQTLDKNDARLYAHTRRAMKLLMLTFVRTSELIQAKWSEFDLDEGLWIIPAERMKSRKDHIVPLSRQAIEILKEQQEMTGKWDWVFPNQVRPAKSMSNNTILKALERMGYKGAMTGHGFRALARTAIRENLRYDSEVIEKQLAHKTSNPLGEAYDRTKFLDERKPMMQDWADYLDAISQPKVIQGDFVKRKKA